MNMGNILKILGGIIVGIVGLVIYILVIIIKEAK